ncbi:hypothetical protein LOAG_11996 [Loa loa]|uniref:Uncharacterized protein n=1 Tax=Loa loa TaxID=7209 RepID=A0A1S0TMJ6_LOALO|nr:hypothetical protein LOAG_11996 [Loa loa]EFO16511.1 hypothetical protein LOAG_11996 [Loa loa]
MRFKAATFVVSGTRTKSNCYLIIYDSFSERKAFFPRIPKHLGFDESMCLFQTEASVCCRIFPLRTRLEYCTGSVKEEEENNHIEILAHRPDLIANRTDLNKQYISSTLEKYLQKSSATERLGLAELRQNGDRRHEDRPNAFHFL